MAQSASECDSDRQMAQSASELKDKNSRGRKSTSNQMEMSKLELMDLDPIEVLDWEVERLEAGLKELGITIGVSWSFLFDIQIQIGKIDFEMLKNWAAKS